MARMLNAKELITQNKRKAPKTKTVIIVIATSIIPLPAMVKLYSFFITNFLAFLMKSARKSPHFNVGMDRACHP